MNSQNTEGSTWKKWDLHVHTPYSIVQRYGGNTDEIWETFITDLEKLPSEFKVIGINDYFFLDGYERVLKEKKEKVDWKNIDLILPVVELRLDKFASVVKRDKMVLTQNQTGIELSHVIFDQLNPETIRQQFLNSIIASLTFTPIKLAF